MEAITLLHGDCVDKLKELDENSIDSVVTDPPYGFSFMGNSWDYNVPSVKIWKEVYRVLKPGGHLLSFGGSRTYHRLVVNIEDAGFEIRDQIMWIYGSGFPKSHNIGKVQEEKEGTTEWEGWGTALKPAHEPICLARKPIDKTVVENVKKWGVGGINIDGSRTSMNESDRQALIAKSSKNPTSNYKDNPSKKYGTYEKDIATLPHEKGRYPTNIILDEESGILLNNQTGEETSRFFYCAKASKEDRDEGLEHLEDKLFGQSGGAQQALKDGKSEYQKTGESSTGLNTIKIRKNDHPTVKPTDLMKYLIRLVTPPNGVVLDPFMGSGSTGKAAKRLGFRFVGIEREEDYMKIAKARIESSMKGTDKVVPKEKQETLNKFFDL